MDSFLSVKEFAQRANMSEETIRRWVRSGKIPNAVKDSDKIGWKIPEIELSMIGNINNQKLQVCLPSKHFHQLQDEMELITLAYQAVTMTFPSEEILNELSNAGIKRTLEILLCMQQSSAKIRNANGFIKKAIHENWCPTSIPIKLPKVKSKGLIELTTVEYQQLMEQKDSSVQQKLESSVPKKVPFYNWLDE